MTTTHDDVSTTIPAGRPRPPAAPSERQTMHTPTPGPRHSRPPRPWGLIAVSAGFLTATATVVAIGLVSLGLTPSLP